MNYLFQKSRFARLGWVLALFFFTACTEDDAQNQISNYIAIPDIHFETKLIEQGIDSDGIVNQQILRTDAEQVTKLNLNLKSHFGDIADLTGIEGFTNITLLYASGQKIKSVDLSFNTKLDTLIISANQLTHLDVSKNTELILLDAQSNELTSVSGVTNAKNLVDLDLSWNYMEEFSINNAKLEVLHFSHNDLKTINTDGAVSLRNILLTTNKLTSVDFSTNTAVETLLISDNKLETINLEQNSNLSHFYMSSNLLTKLDVSNNNKLVDMRVDRNPTLTCIKIQKGQSIPTVSISDYQQLSDDCN